MPADSIWEGSSFVDKSCVELMEKSNPDSYPEWCAFLSQGIVSDRTAANACCFCGGGQLVKPMTCQNQLFSDLKGSNIDCEFIEKCPNPEEFCADFGNTKFSSTGPSIIDACCICGGGEIVPELKSIEDTSRRLNDEISANIDPSVLYNQMFASNDAVNAKVDYTHTVSWYDRNRAFVTGKSSLRFHISLIACDFAAQNLFHFNLVFRILNILGRVTMLSKVILAARIFRN